MPRPKHRHRSLRKLPRRPRRPSPLPQNHLPRLRFLASMPVRRLRPLPISLEAFRDSIRVLRCPPPNRLHLNLLNPSRQSRRSRRRQNQPLRSQLNSRRPPQNFRAFRPTLLKRHRKSQRNRRPLIRPPRRPSWLQHPLILRRPNQVRFLPPRQRLQLPRSPKAQCPKKCSLWWPAMPAQ